MLESPVSTEILSRATFAGEDREIVAGPIPLTIHHPTSNEIKGQFLLVPGWSGPRAGPADLLVHLASRLAANGYRAIRLDLPGRGDASGHFNACGLDEMIVSTKSVLDARSELNPQFILGLCSGGNVALGTLGLLKTPAGQPPPALIALSVLPFQPARTKKFEDRKRWKLIKQYAAKALSPHTWSRLIRGEINLDRVKKNVKPSEKSGNDRNLKDSTRDIESELRTWKGRALFVWGDGDEEGTLARAHFEALHAKGMGTPQSTFFHTIPGANHNFYAKSWREEIGNQVIQFANAGR